MICGQLEKVSVLSCNHFTTHKSRKALYSVAQEREIVRRCSADDG